MKRPITIISSISSLLFLTAIIWFGAGIYVDKKSGGEKAQNRYEKLLSDTKSALSESRFGTSDFSNKFIRAIGNIDDFSSLKLKINGELVYSYPPNTFSLPSADLVKHFDEDVFVNSDNYFNLSASIYLMKPNSIYNYARIAFLLILVGTIIVVVLIILTNGTDDALIKTGNYNFKKRDFSDVYRPFADLDNTEKKAKTEKTEKTEQIEQIEKNKADEAKKSESLEEKQQRTQKTSENAIKKTLFNPEIAKVDEPQEIHEENQNPLSQNENELSEEISITFPEETVLSDENEDEAETLDIIDQLEQENAENNFDDIFGDEILDESENPEQFFAEPSSIEQDSETENDAEKANSAKTEQTQENPAAREKNVSPITGLFVQSELEPAIDEEIAKGKENLTVALIKINSLDRGNTISSKILDILKEETERVPDSPDFFEYKSDSYAVTLGETDLQTTVDLFEEIYNKISDFLKDNNSANEVSIGISSVTSRKIKAERLLLEASQALDYATSDPDSPIVAFRANPEKYKEIEEA